ncbi:MAG: glycosyltransferase family 4 protein, partial [Nocardioidaceae bacterium]
MRIGMVCPYSLDVPGGVQNHVRDLTEQLTSLGHQVSVLAPGEEGHGLPGYVVPAGRAVPVPYNGSVARLTFGPLAAKRTRRWLREGRFDLLHIHEPSVPSVSVLALWAARGPIVGTFHTSNTRSRAMSSAAAMLRPSMEKIGGRIAVSEHARRTLVQHFGG